MTGPELADGDLFTVVDVSVAAALKNKAIAALETVLGLFLRVLPYPGSRTLWVDAAGDDATGTRGRSWRPFLTPVAALAAASANDLIIVGPGSYTVATTLGKHLVNWEVKAGVTLTATSADGAAIAVFGDSGTAKTFRVTGRGALVLAGTMSGDANSVSACVSVTNASSDVRVEAASLTCSCAIGGNDDVPAAVNHDAGTLHVTADSVTTSGGAGYGVWWKNGDLRTQFKLATSNGDATFYAGVGSTPTGDWNDYSQTITNTSATGSAVDGFSPNAEAKFWVRAAALISANGQAVGVAGGKTYVTAQKVVGCTLNLSDAVGVVGSTGGILYLTVQKLTGTYESGIRVAGGTVEGTVMQVEDLGNMTRAFRNQGGTLELDRAQCVMATGDGVLHSGGTTRLMKVRLNTAASAGKSPARLAGAGLIVDGCTLVANAAADSVTAASAQTVTNYNSKFNTAKNVNVTAAVDAIVAQAGVV